MKTFLASATLCALPLTASAGWTGSQVIQAIYPQGTSEEVIIQLPSYNDAGCTVGTSKKYLLLGNHPNFKAIYALLLAANAAGTPVNLHLATGTCTANGYSQITMAISGTLN